MRKKLENNRSGMTEHITACGMDFYVTVNFYEDLKPGEIFVRIAKEGSTLSGLIDSLVTTASIALQYGTPWEVIESKWLGHRFPPNDDENPSIIHALAATISRLISRKADLWK